MKIYPVSLVTIWMICACRTQPTPSKMETLPTQGNILYVGTVLSDTNTLINPETQYRSPLLSSTSAIEIWFTRSSVWGNTTTYKLFFDTCWKIKYPAMDVYDTKAGKTFPLKDIKDGLVEQLVSNHIFSLPDLGTTNMDSFYFDLETARFTNANRYTTDGTCYTIAYKVGTKFRAYSFCNLDFYASQSPHVTAYTHYNKIVELFASIPIK